MTREGYLTVGEAATLLGISRQAVHDRIRTGKYPRAEKVVDGKQERYEIPRDDVLAEVAELSSGHQVLQVRSELDTSKTADLSRYLWATLEMIETQNTGKDQIIAMLEKQLDAAESRTRRLEKELEEVRKPPPPSWWQWFRRSSILSLPNI
jgi:predicted RNase H-like nuclease (RuvC/YqgF family)